jgi:hypothetical protein
MAVLSSLVMCDDIVRTAAKEFSDGKGSANAQQSFASAGGAGLRCLSARRRTCHEGVVRFSRYEGGWRYNATGHEVLMKGCFLEQRFFFFPKMSKRGEMHAILSPRS